MRTIKGRIIRLPGRLKYDLADPHDSFLRPTSMPDHRAHVGIVTGLSRPRGLCVVGASVVAALILFSDGAVDIDPAASWGNGVTFVSVRIHCLMRSETKAALQTHFYRGHTTNAMCLCF